MLTPIQTAVSHNLGDRTAAFVYDRMTEACVRPQGMAHLEDASFAADFTVARDFDLGMTGPPLSYSMDFIAGGLVGMIGGLASAVVLFGFASWAPLLLAGAWLATHWLLRESAVWRDRNTDEIRSAQRDADYAYRLAVDPPASKELRLFGLVRWTIDRFVARRTRLHQLQYEATRLRERPLAWSLLLVAAANVIVLWLLASAAALESHVATLLASIATIAHQERPEYLDCLSVLRNQVFMLDHMYMSLFSTCDSYNHAHGANVGDGIGGGNGGRIANGGPGAGVPGSAGPDAGDLLSSHAGLGTGTAEERNGYAGIGVPNDRRFRPWRQHHQRGNHGFLS